MRCNQQINIISCFCRVSHGIHGYKVLYNEVAYFTPYGADHVGVFDLKTERFGAMAETSFPGAGDGRFRG